MHTLSESSTSMTKPQVTLALLAVIAAAFAEVSPVCQSVLQCRNEIGAICNRQTDSCPPCLAVSTGGYMCTIKGSNTCQHDTIDCSSHPRSTLSPAGTSIPISKSANLSTVPVLTITPPPTWSWYSNVSNNRRNQSSTGDQPELKSHGLSCLHIVYIIGVSICAIAIFVFLFVYRPSEPSPLPEPRITRSDRKFDQMDIYLSNEEGARALKKALHPIDMSPQHHSRESLFDSQRSNGIVPLLEEPKPSKSKHNVLAIAEDTEVELKSDQRLSSGIFEFLQGRGKKRESGVKPPLHSMVMSPYSDALSSGSSDSNISDASEEVYMSRSFSWHKYSGGQV